MNFIRKLFNRKQSVSSSEQNLQAANITARNAPNTSASEPLKVASPDNVTRPELMSDVDLMFKEIVEPWWEHNRTIESPDFDALRRDIAPYNDLCQHAAWNGIGRYFIREQRETVGLQCLVEALRCSATNDSAAWAAFTHSNRPELTNVKDQLSRLPRRPEPGDVHTNAALVEQLAIIIGKPGDPFNKEQSVETKNVSTASSKVVAQPERKKFASHRTSSLPKISESESYNLIKYLEEDFSHRNPKTYAYFLTPRELCDIAEFYSDDMIVYWNDKDYRLTAVSDVLVRLAWKAHPNTNSITVVGLYEFKTSHEAKNVWFEKDVIVKGVPVESVLDIRERYALNFQSGSYSINTKDLVTISSAELWERICERCKSIGAPLD